MKILVTWTAGRAGVRFRGLLDGNGGVEKFGTDLLGIECWQSVGQTMAPTVREQAIDALAVAAHRSVSGRAALPNITTMGHTGETIGHMGELLVVDIGNIGGHA